MSDAKVTPENSPNAIVSDPSDILDDSDSRETNSPNLALPVMHEYQCVACKVTRTSPSEMHQHQTYFHTVEELSLSIVGLQMLYKISSKNKSVNKRTDDFDNFALNQKAMDNNEKFQPSISSLKTEKPICPDVQKEPMCLKIPEENSLPDKCSKKVNNSSEGQKTARKTSRPKVPSIEAKKPTLLKQQKRKNVYILPTLSNLEEHTIPSRKENNSARVGNLTNLIKTDVSTNIQDINIFEKPSVSCEGIHLAQSSLIRKEISEISQSHPICLKISPKSVLLSPKVKYQVEKPKMIFHKSEDFQKSQVFLRIPEGKFVKSEVTIEKIEGHFKKPGPIFKKPAVTIKKLEATKQPKEQANIGVSEYQITNNLNNLDTNIQKFCLKRTRSESLFRQLEPLVQNVEPPVQNLESPVQNLEPPVQNLKPAVQKFEPSFQKLDQCLESLLQPPKLPPQTLEPPQKKFKTSLKLPSFQEEFKNEIFLQNLKILPIDEVVENGWHDSVKEKLYLENELPTDITKVAMQDEVVDNGWHDSVKKKLYLENELPTDITKVAMQDLPNMQNFEAPPNGSENFNYNDLSNEMFMNLDSYLMTPETQPLDGSNFSSQRMNLDNNLPLQSSNYQAISNPVPGYDYSNATNFIFENNQPLVSPVEPNENTLMNSDTNSIYTELLPVFYH